MSTNIISMLTVYIFCFAYWNSNNDILRFERYRRKKMTYNNNISFAASTKNQISFP